MPIQILMPALSPTMTEGNLAKWLKKEGDKIKPGEVIAEIETDKATMEVEAVDEGILGKILIPGGTENVKVNELIALVLEEGEEKSALDNFVAPKKETPKAQEIVENKTSEAAPVIVAQDSKVNGNRVFASPLAKRIASQNNVNLANVKGTGPNGRIIRADVEKSSSARMPSMSNGQVTRDPNLATMKNNSIMRKVIAKRLLESKQTIPHFYLTSECNISKLLSLREDINSHYEGLKISVNDFIIKASALALKEVPEANSSWTEEATILYNNVDISVAVSVEGGLITPIIFNADQKNIMEISREMKILAIRARENALAPHEFQGGGFSISNLGMYGISKFDAIINPPQTCILAVGASAKKPIVENDQVKIADLVNLTLSCDHRVVDGVVGAKFLASLKKFIEKPALLLI